MSEIVTIEMVKANIVTVDQPQPTLSPKGFSHYEHGLNLLAHHRTKSDEKQQSQQQN